MDLQEAIKAHADWKMKLRGAISAQSALDAESISKDNGCALGKWLHGESKVAFGHYPAHVECVRHHAVFHREAGKIAAAINSGQYQSAERMLGAGTPYAEASHAVIMAIGTLKREAHI
jgi:methyl-accepting chemotaxis protein